VKKIENLELKGNKKGNDFEENFENK